ncbi:MAG: nicotinate (nicotinamide) nucleotide adenylyltransferase [Candidatus Omnitrophica bacterium CG1_02_46_14]|nr:MAG: nicotinate (nicotinamide) nucleotide adenylyltransferase [Candidatus Omnitrophica bacterium CG1_02_46_14]
MRIGLFGGSFNPVHRGHIYLAHAAFLELTLDRVVFIPCNQNPLKAKEELLPASLRVKLLKRAICGAPGFSVSLFEIQRKGPSFTVDTLKYFRKRLGKSAVLYFLTGVDSLKTLSRWKSVDEIFKLCHFVVMTRPGFAIHKSSRSFFYIPFDALPLSSSRIRSRLEKRRSIQGMVPPGTASLLKKYYQKKIQGGLKSKFKIKSS